MIWNRARLIFDLAGSSNSLLEGLSKVARSTLEFVSSEREKLLLNFEGLLLFLLLLGEPLVLDLFTEECVGFSRFVASLGVLLENSDTLIFEVGDPHGVHAIFFVEVFRELVEGLVLREVRLGDNIGVLHKVGDRTVLGVINGANIFELRLGHLLSEVGIHTGLVKKIRERSN